MCECGCGCVHVGVMCTWAQVEGIIKLWTAEPGKHRERGIRHEGSHTVFQPYKCVKVLELTRSFLDRKDSFFVCVYQDEINKQNGFNSGAHLFGFTSWKCLPSSPQVAFFVDR